MSIDTQAPADAPTQPQRILPFEPDALREKYREERDKRLRADGHGLRR